MKSAFYLSLLCSLAGSALAAYGVHTTSNHRVFVSTPSSKWPKRTVADCCQRTFLTLSPSTTVDEAMDLFLSLRVQGAPVVNENLELVGMVSQFDFLSKEAFGGSLLPLEQGGTSENLKRYVAAAKQICGTCVSDVMSTGELVTVTPGTSMRAAAELMKRHRLHHLPVVESAASETVVGLLTAEEVLRDLLHVVKSLPPASSDVDKESFDLAP